MNTTLMKTVTGHEIAALLNPRLAVLITSCDQHGRPNVMTVAWHTPLSHQPPLLGVSIARSRYSHFLIQETGEFIVNIVGQALVDAVKICGTYTGDVDDKLDIAGLRTRMATYVQPPVLLDAVGLLECRVVDQVETGDHTFFIGRVLLAQVRENCFDDAWISKDGDTVLQCLQRDQYGVFLKEGSNGSA